MYTIICIFILLYIYIYIYIYTYYIHRHVGQRLGAERPGGLLIVFKLSVAIHRLGSRSLDQFEEERWEPESGKKESSNWNGGRRATRRSVFVCFCRLGRELSISQNWLTGLNMATMYIYIYIYMHIHIRLSGGRAAEAVLARGPRHNH